MCRFAQTTLPATSHAPELARRFVRTTCLAWDLDGLAGDLALLASELVTNAVVHARSGSTLTISVAEGIVEVSVADAAERAPAFHPGGPHGDADDPDRESGRGLRIVDALADHWGTAPRPTGKAVWMKVAAPPYWPWQQGCVCHEAPTHTSASGHPVADMTN